MASLYLIDFSINYRGMEPTAFHKTWLDDIYFFLSKQKEGKVKHTWKVVAERKVYIVIEETASELDKLLFSTPLMKKMGDQVEVKVTSLLSYETFVNNINEIRGDETRVDPVATVRKEGGVYYFAEFEIGYTGQSYEDFLRIWSEEAGFALKVAKPYGIALDLYKCVGERRVIVIVREESPAGLDKIMFQLPLMVQMGHNVNVKVKSIVPFETLAKNLSDS